LNRAGYVHRDISTGNIIAFGGGGRLSDLEYTKRYVAPVPISENSKTPEKDSKSVSSSD
jgi:hypothetical protein